MTILCLTGWQQAADELAPILPTNTMHFNYASYIDVEVMFRDLPQHPEIAIGWSLGGQLLVRAIAGGYIRPKQLLLLATPFQYIADEQFPYGMDAAGLQEFKDNYIKNPLATLAQFNALIGLGDSRSMRVIRALNNCSQLWPNGLFWLNELSSWTCGGIDFLSFPETVIVHGEKDKVIDAASAQVFKAYLPTAELLLWPDCGHAPHIHNPDALRELISRYV